MPTVPCFPTPPLHPTRLYKIVDFFFLMGLHTSAYTSLGAHRRAHTSLGAHMSAQTSFGAHASARMSLGAHTNAHTNTHMCVFLPWDPICIS